MRIIQFFLKNVRECNNTDPGIEDEALFAGRVGRIYEPEWEKRLPQLAHSNGTASHQNESGHAPINC